ncbi:DUF4430 domain-containing protein [Bacillus sp. UNC438CL73TsuS30]|uniref:DUF4430 domain-containing protein n=1 Tax=Bacillus sp. UNC438CL73TsuS30 TaxID=1340434 RepID=UPI00068A4626|nr:DUF4430 domain-containing protein [Bacillus sp. UNC438CL73TsuS30]
MFGKRKNFWMAMLLVIALFTANFQTSVMAAAAGNQGTITVIGKDEANPLLAEKTVTYDEKETAAQVLEKAVGEKNVEYTHYDNLGDMITGINGLKADDNHYWALYINGIQAQVGAGSYTVQNGDNLSFKYSDFSPASNTATFKVVDDKKKTIKESPFPIAFIGTPTAMQLLQVALGPDKVGLKDTDWGKMIVSIYGLKAEDPYYWAFYVNGQMASVGAETYQLKAGDQISFQLESWETQADGGDQGDTTPTDKPATGEKDPVVGTVSNATIQKAVGSVSEYIQKHEINEWEAIALKQVGKTIPATYLDKVKKAVKEEKGNFRRITDTERYVLGILAAGGDPTNIEGYNLVQAVYNGNVTKQGLNGAAFALLSLDSDQFKIPTSAKWTREKLVNLLLEKQNKDGGWAWDESPTSDVDSTGMVLSALAPYKSDKNVKEKINSAVNYLSKEFKDAKIDNSTSASQVVIALSSLGIDPTGSLFSTDQNSLMQYLLSFQNKDGGFGWKKGDATDTYSTVQGFQAVVAYKLYTQGKGSIYHLELMPQKTKTVNKETEKAAPVVNQTKSAANSNNQGHRLPDTATNSVNILVAGVLLILIGIALYMRKKKINA